MFWVEWESWADFLFRITKANLADSWTLLSNRINYENVVILHVSPLQCLELLWLYCLEPLKLCLNILYLSVSTYLPAFSFLYFLLQLLYVILRDFILQASTITFQLSEVLLSLLNISPGYLTHHSSFYLHGVRSYLSRLVFCFLRRLRGRSRTEPGGL